MSLAASRVCPWCPSIGPTLSFMHNERLHGEEASELPQCLVQYGLSIVMNGYSNK